MKGFLLAVLVIGSAIAPAAPATERHEERRAAREAVSVESTVPASPVLLACENACARARYTRE